MTKLKINGDDLRISGMAGRNAIGKSTFMKCLAGILETDEKNLELKLKISYKPQYVEYKGEETVAMIIKKEKIIRKLYISRWFFSKKREYPFHG